MKIDSHQHFWKYSSLRDAWITDDMKIIQRDFMPSGLKPILDANTFDGSVAVQADQSEAETNFLLDLSKKYDFIKAVVGWVNLRNENVIERLEYFSQFEKLKGFRHIVQAEADDFFLNKEFCRGIALLSRYGFTYDILIKPQHLPSTIEFVRQFPEQMFVIDHIGKPEILNSSRNSGIDWEKAIKEIGKSENVYIKLSGIVTEGDWQKWKKDDFTKYIDVVLNSFGAEKIMFGSDWPVCLVAASYEQVCEIVEEHIEHLSAFEKQLIWGQTAIDFYRLWK
ncbi:MAG TPA: amidohydrolase family protein [Chitinophagaceae bacterium]|nr:amidohydrolase family protein [Chitinophagaceae bacterium]